MKKFFQKLFNTEAYINSLTQKQLLCKCLDKEAIWDYAYAQGRLDEVMGFGPDVVSRPVPPPRKVRPQ
jgi:hypothetical protein